MSPNALTGVVIRRGKFGHTQGEEGHMTMETEIGVMRVAIP